MMIFGFVYSIVTLPFRGAWYVLSSLTSERLIEERSKGWLIEGSRESIHDYTFGAEEEEEDEEGIPHFDDFDDFEDGEDSEDDSTKYEEDGIITPKEPDLGFIGLGEFAWWSDETWGSFREIIERIPVDLNNNNNALFPIDQADIFMDKFLLRACAFLLSFVVGLAFKLLFVKHIRKSPLPVTIIIGDGESKLSVHYTSDTEVGTNFNANFLFKSFGPTVDNVYVDSSPSHNSVVTLGTSDDAVTHDSIDDLPIFRRALDDEESTIGSFSPALGPIPRSPSLDSNGSSIHLSVLSDEISQKLAVGEAPLKNDGENPSVSIELGDKQNDEFLENQREMSEKIREKRPTQDWRNVLGDNILQVYITADPIEQGTEENEIETSTDLKAETIKLNANGDVSSAALEKTNLKAQNERPLYNGNDNVFTSSSVTPSVEPLGAPVNIISPDIEQHEIFIPHDPFSAKLFDDEEIERHLGTEISRDLRPSISETIDQKFGNEELNIEKRRDWIKEFEDLNEVYSRSRKASTSLPLPVKMAIKEKPYSEEESINLLYYEEPKSPKSSIYKNMLKYEDLNGSSPELQEEQEKEKKSGTGYLTEDSSSISSYDESSSEYENNSPEGYGAYVNDGSSGNEPSVFAFSTVREARTTNDRAMNTERVSDIFTESSGKESFPLGESLDSDKSSGLDQYIKDEANSESNTKNSETYPTASSLTLKVHQATSLAKISPSKIPFRPLYSKPGEKRSPSSVKHFNKKYSLCPLLKELLMDKKDPDMDNYLENKFGDDPEIEINIESLKKLSQDSIDELLGVFKGCESSDNWKNRFDGLRILIGHVRLHLPDTLYEYFAQKMHESLVDILSLIHTKRTKLLERTIIFVRDLAYYGSSYSVSRELFKSLIHLLIPLTRSTSQFIKKLALKSLCLMIQSVDYESFKDNFELIFNDILSSKKLHEEKGASLFMIKFYIAANFSNMSDVDAENIMGLILPYSPSLAVDNSEYTRSELIQIYLCLHEKNPRSDLLQQMFSYFTPFVRSQLSSTTPDILSLLLRDLAADKLNIGSLSHHSEVSGSSGEYRASECSITEVENV